MTLNTSINADMGVFRMQGKVFFTSDISDMRKALLEFRKCSNKKLYLETFLGAGIDKVTDEKNSNSLRHYINYQKLNHHAVISSSTKMEDAVKSQFRKCFSEYTRAAMTLSLSEFYLQNIVRDLVKVREMRLDLAKLYSHDIFQNKSTSTVWKKK